MISKNFTKYFQIPLYWLTLLVFFFLVSSLIPMLTGYFVSLLTSGTDKHEVFSDFRSEFSASDVIFEQPCVQYRAVAVPLVENPLPDRFHKPCR